MILHMLIVDDEEDVLESLVPGFVNDFSRRLAADRASQRANQEASFPLPKSGRLNIKVTATGYESQKLTKYTHHSPVHVHLHLCCEKGGSFRHALRLLKEHFFAVVVSDLRFAHDAVGSRAGRLFIEDVQRRNPESFCILYSAYQKPEGFAAERFVRKGSSAHLSGEELLDKMLEGFTRYLLAPGIRRFARELSRRGLVYQSESFGSMLRRLYDYAGLYFGPEPPNPEGRRRPRPTLLIDGETGTGKTELAGLLHQLSERREYPFVSATCNQLTDEHFLRSILFGHIKGSFSGATADRAGLVQSAGKGMILLDDLHKLSDGSSVILHSFLDDGEFSHLGEDEVRRVAEAAILCTVETPRWEEIKSEQLLADSFLNRVEQLILRVPPLRARPEDISYQAEFFCHEYSSQLGEPMELSGPAIAWLVDFGFPGGNSRKLRDFIKGLVTSHARVTDYLDVPELEEYAADVGLLGQQVKLPARGVAAVPRSSTSAAMVLTESPSPSLEPPANRAGRVPLDPWQSRMIRLATKALADELQLSLDDASGLAEALFDNHFTKVWEAFQGLTTVREARNRFDIKLFDELFRYFAVYVFGNPAKAAKELRMKDNALREFIYSREEKRDLTEKE